ncbi:MAG TPA: glycosyltransferase [Pyrinomonadaceae bacterium]
MRTWLKNSLPFPVKLALKRALVRLSQLRPANKPSWVLETPTLSKDGALDFQQVIDVASRTSEKLANLLGHRAIKTSIIIPVYNKADFTFQCLSSLFDEIDLATTEVIVVNNASTDETSRLLDHFKESVQVLDNTENRGFVDASNQGAARAKGDYLVFLNNDTVVLSNWLSALLETVERDERVGAVGSMFLYPDGMVQEAGSIIWRTGEAFHYGWHGSPHDTRFRFAREVDYCSGASLLIRKTLFAQLGGFDCRFAPAYYEDTDLCMGVRSLGYRVVYQPASRLVHYEGASAGRDVKTGMKNYQLVNREKFYDKWKEVLQRDHLANEPRNIQRAAHRTPKDALIVFEDRIPTPDRDAGSGRMLMILRTLAKKSRTLFVHQSMNVAAHYQEALWREMIETADMVDYPRLLKERKFQVAIISRPYVAAAVLKSIRRRAPGTKIIFDMVDVHYLRFELEHKTTGDREAARQAKHYRKMELDLVRESDYVWCTSTEDLKAVAEEVPGKPIALIPTIHSLQQRGPAAGQREGLLFIGNFNHTPNRDAVVYFVREIFPLIQRSLPEIKFNVIGGNTPPEVQSLASEAVRLHGFVPDIAPLFHSSKVFVAPLRFGAGVKGKIGDALSYGLPVVTTSVGASGMGIDNEHQAIIADSPEEFAAAVVRVHTDDQLWRQLSDAGYAHVEKYFSPEVVEKTIEDSITSLRD